MTDSGDRHMNLLLVEDDDEFRETCALWMSRKGHTVTEAPNAHDALHLCQQKYFDVAVVDLDMPGMNGLELLDRLREDNVDWPGNVRQLINVIERATILAEDGRVELEDLPREVTGPGGSNTPATIASVMSGSEKLEDLERAHVLQVLHTHDGNKAQAARALGIHRRKLYRLLERLEISPAEYTPEFSRVCYVPDRSVASSSVIVGSPVRKPCLTRKRSAASVVRRKYSLFLLRSMKPESRRHAVRCSGNSSFV